jgi:hypothetical protein
VVAKAEKKDRPESDEFAGLHAAVDRMVMADWAEGDGLNLGQLIALLEAWPDPTDACRFGFGMLAPCGIDSYRGYYNHLALDFEEPKTYPAPTVADVLKIVKAAVGKTYQGYKGGDFTMDLETPVWVAHWGETSDTVITGFSEDATHQMVLTTAYRPLH